MCARGWTQRQSGSNRVSRVMPTRARIAAWLMASSLLASAACGGSNGEGESPTPTPAATEIATPTPTPPAATGSPTPGPSPTSTSTATTTPESMPSGPAEAALAVAFPGLPALPRPIQMVEIPDQGWMLVALQEGRIVAFPQGGPYGDPVTVYDGRTETATSGNEMGLLSIALDPSFGANGYLYAYYSPTGATRTTRLSRFETSGAGDGFRVDESSELPILVVHQPFANHNGGTIAFGPDGMLYLGLGDGGSGGDPRNYAQDRSVLLGSIVRIDVRGASESEPYVVPADNPFIGEAGAEPEIWAYGFRNPWRMSFDAETGLLWVGDVGQNRIEEVDIVRRGGNYGWNIMEGSACFEPPTGCDTSGLELPVAEYSIAGAPECAVTGGFVYRGAAVPALRGYYVYGDYCSGKMWALDAAAAAAGELVEPVVLRDSGPTISSFARDANGELYFLSFDGQIYRFTAAE